VVTAVGAKPIQTPRPPTPKLNIPKRLSYIYILYLSSEDEWKHWL
jgi:hypothetical protein